MRLSLLALMLATLLLFTACDTFGGSSDYVQSNPEHEQYFRGSEGIRMRVEPGLPPPRMYYYPEDSGSNDFVVSVNLKNEGASDAVGATYISGFDPNMIMFDGTAIKQGVFSDCKFDVMSIFSGNFALGASCNGGSASIYDADTWSLNVNNLGSLLGIGDIIGDVSVNDNNGNIDVSFGVGGLGNLEVFNHGRSLALALAGFDLTSNNGYPFGGDIADDDLGVMRGDNYYYPGGDISYQAFQGHVIGWPQGLDQAQVDFLITSCYGYTTYAAPTVCIDPSPYDLTEKACTPRDYSWSGSQGAPVAITGMKVENTPKSVMMTFTVQNVGTGRVFDWGYLSRCSPYSPNKLTQQYMDIVYIGDARVGDKRLDCTPNHQVRLTNGVGTFTCEYKYEFTNTKSAYATPVVVELWYGYQQTERAYTTIKRAS